jgi:hypothetical protein
MLELRTLLAKIHFKFDLELVNSDLDWHRDARMHTLWDLPMLVVRLKPRGDKEG